MSSYSVSNPGNPVGAYRNLTATFLRYRDASRAHSRPFNGQGVFTPGVVEHPGVVCSAGVVTSRRASSGVCATRPLPTLRAAVASGAHLRPCVSSLWLTTPAHVFAQTTRPRMRTAADCWPQPWGVVLVATQRGAA